MTVDNPDGACRVRRRLLVPSAAPLRAAIVVAVVVVSGCGGGDASPTPAEPSTLASPSARPDDTACTPLSDLEVAALVGEDSSNYKRAGPFTATAALRTPVTSPNEFFSWVVYLQGDSPDGDGRVYVFATSVDDLTDPGGGVLGADPVTRDAWTWGEVAERGAPLTTAARSAVAGADVCLP
jgi:hypothetical protein